MAHSTSHLTPQDLWNDVVRVRESSPLVHSITNFVVMNLNANVLLALGASPVMAHAHEEVVDMVAIAQSLVLNIGTLEPYWIDSMCLALQAAHKKGITTVLDPVGAGATPYRNASIARVMGVAAPTIIRGNGSEIMSTAGASVTTGEAASCAGVAAQRRETQASV